MKIFTLSLGGGITGDYILLHIFLYLSNIFSEHVLLKLGKKLQIPFYK